MLTPDEQTLFDFALGSLPSWVRTNDELLTAFAKIFGAAWAHVRYLFEQTLITTSSGATATTPDWMGQHARDRDTSRGANEADLTLAERLRVIPDALTRDAILDAANAILAASGVVGSAAMLELPRDRARVGKFFVYNASSGGTFTKSGSTMTFTPTVPWGIQPWISPSVFPGDVYSLGIVTAANAGNVGQFVITGLSGNALVYTNAGGVAAVDPTAFYGVLHQDPVGNNTDSVGGLAMSFIGRGYRITTQRPNKVLIILPYGTTAAVAASIAESVRQKKAAGYGVIVERRLNP